MERKLHGSVTQRDHTQISQGWWWHVTGSVPLNRVFILIPMFQAPPLSPSSPLWHLFSFLGYRVKSPWVLLCNIKVCRLCVSYGECQECLKCEFCRRVQTLHGFPGWITSLISSYRRMKGKQSWTCSSSRLQLASEGDQKNAAQHQ